MNPRPYDEDRRRDAAKQRLVVIYSGPEHRPSVVPVYDASIPQRVHHYTSR